VFVRLASIEAPSSLQCVAELYNLTRSEIRVLRAIAEVTGIPAVAEVLGVSEATVKTHLQHLFAKTGVNRQKDLVRLMAAHASPLAS
jgi:DNA-binding NarL/FixJ family response regulator